MFLYNGADGQSPQMDLGFRVRSFTTNSLYPFLINNTNREYLEILYTNALQYRRGALVARMKHTHVYLTAAIVGNKRYRLTFLLEIQVLVAGHYL